MALCENLPRCKRVWSSFGCKEGAILAGMAWNRINKPRRGGLGGEKPSLCAHDPANGDKEPSCRRMRFERGDLSSPLFLRDSDSPSPFKQQPLQQSPLWVWPPVPHFRYEGLQSSWLFELLTGVEMSHGTTGEQRDRKIWEWQGKRYNWYAEQEYSIENLIKILQTKISEENVSGGC